MEKLIHVVQSAQSAALEEPLQPIAAQSMALVGMLTWVDRHHLLEKARLGRERAEAFCELG